MVSTHNLQHCKVVYNISPVASDFCEAISLLASVDIASSTNDAFSTTIREMKRIGPVSRPRPLLSAGRIVALIQQACMFVIASDFCEAISLLASVEIALSTNDTFSTKIREMKRIGPVSRPRPLLSAGRMVALIQQACTFVIASDFCDPALAVPLSQTARTAWAGEQSQHWQAVTMAGAAEGAMPWQKRPGQ